MSRLARLACSEQDIPALSTEMEGRGLVGPPLGPLQQALQGNSTPLAEVYLVVGDEDRFLEGYVDLLATSPDAVSILDYKTDRVSNDAEAAAKHEQYAPHLAAYAQAVGWVGRRKLTSAQLVFAASTVRQPS